MQGTIEPTTSVLAPSDVTQLAVVGGVSAVAVTALIRGYRNGEKKTMAAQDNSLRDEDADTEYDPGIEYHKSLVSGLAIWSLLFH